MGNFGTYIQMTLIACAMAQPLSAQVSEQAFLNPPQSARPSTYWQWMNGNISTKGLTMDLEYMNRAGYGAAMIFDTGVGIPRGTVNYNSPEWHDAVLHSVKEAARLGIKLSMHNAPGYSGTGGTWIDEAHSMKQIVWTDTYANTDRHGNVKVIAPRPYAKAGYYRDACVLAFPSLEDEATPFSSMIKSITLDGKPVDKTILTDYDLNTSLRMEQGQSLVIEMNDFFTAQAATIFRGAREKPLDPHDGPRDYAPRLTLQTSTDGVHYSPSGTFISSPLRAMDAPSTLTFSKVKSMFFRITTSRGTNIAELDFHASARLSGYAAKAGYVSATVPLGGSSQIVPVGSVIQPNTVVDITDRMESNGMIEWKAPSNGRWTIVRIGFTTTGEKVAAAPDSGVGLECDKMDSLALDIHFDKFLAPLLRELSPWCGSTLESLVIDSWEAGRQNWTANLPADFKKRRCYEITPWLPALTGRIVGSMEATERFLWDFRRTLADMFLENYVEHFKKRAAQYNLKYAGEAYGDGNFESLEMAARQDLPMCEFWTHYIYGNITTTMMAASTAHVWGRNIVQCECYTGTPFNSKFTEHPYGMKALGDYIMTAGVNRFVYHATTHQPYTGSQQGNIMTMGPFGTHLDRNSTWADMFSEYNMYNSRCAYMLQQGRYVADVLYVKNEIISSGVNNYNTAEPLTPYGYRWDIACAEVLRKPLTVNDGAIMLSSGMKYRLMVAEPMPRTSPDVLRRLVGLTRQGMTLIINGKKPDGYVGLDEAKDREVKALADTLWHEGRLGAGCVLIDRNIGDVLNDIGVQPDFAFKAERADAMIRFIHRTVDGDEVYFISNHRRRKEKLTATFRVTNKVPQLWDAETGNVKTDIAYQQDSLCTKLNLTLSECGSIFVVFKNGTPKPSIITDVVVKPTLTHTKNGMAEVKNFDSTFTISLWAKPETFAAAGRGFLLFPCASRSGRAQVGISMGQNGVRVYERNQNNDMVIDCKQPIEGWTHIALAYDNGVPTLFLNGKEVAKGRKSNNICSPAIDVPMAEEQFASVFEGDMTQPNVYNYVLCQNKIDSIVNAGVPAPQYDGCLWRDLSSEWTVSFPSWSKAPSEVSMPKLQALSKHTDFNIRHFSGTATYTKTFHVNGKDIRRLHQSRVLLNLGRVENIAEVSVNGSPYETVWKAPFSTDITDKLKKGLNHITVRVTNLYPNRMIGDEHLPNENEYDQYGQLKSLPEWYKTNAVDNRKRVLFTTWKHYNANDPLLDAGLIGPVCISIIHEQINENEK